MRRLQSPINNPALDISVRRLLFCLLLVTAATGVAPANAVAQNKRAAKSAASASRSGAGWTGSYIFSYQAVAPKRRRQTDVTPFTEYVITVKANGKNYLAATLEINGIQQFEIYECSVKATGGKAEFVFERAGDGDSGANNQSRFERGELMFTLAKTKIGDRTKYSFEPAAFKIKRLSAGKQSIVFEKQ